MASLHDRVHHVLIGDGDNSNSFNGLTLMDLEKGDLALMDVDGNIVTTNTAAGNIGANEPVQLVNGLRRGRSYNVTPHFTANDILRVNTQDFTDAGPEVITIGDSANNNGITDAVVTDDEEYRLTIVFLDDHRLNQNRQTRQSIYEVTPRTGATAYGLLTALAAKTNKASVGSDTRFLDSKVSAEVRSAEGAATPGSFAGTNDVTVRYQSREVVFDDDQSGVISVNDLIKLDDGVYRVVSIDNTGTVIQLDRPFGRKFGTILDPREAATVAVNTAGYGPVTGVTHFDIELRTQAVDRAELIDKYEWYNISANLTEGDDERVLNVPVADNDGPFRGHGTFPQVQDDEQANMMRRGHSNFRVYPTADQQGLVRLAERDCGYHQITFMGEFSGRASLERQRNMPFTFNLYIKSGQIAGGTNPQAENGGDNFLDVLNGWLVGTGLIAAPGFTFPN